MTMLSFRVDEADAAETMAARRTVTGRYAAPREVRASAGVDAAHHEARVVTSEGE